MSGNTAYTPLGSTYIILIGGKITIRSLLGDQSFKLRLSLLNTYLALSAIHTMLPFKLRILKIDIILPLFPFKYPMCVYAPAVLLLTA